MGHLSNFAKANKMTLQEAAHYIMENKDSYASGGEIKGYAEGDFVEGTPNNVGGGEYDAILADLAQRQLKIQQKQAQVRANNAKAIAAEKDAAKKAELARKDREQANSLHQQELVLATKKNKVEKLIQQYQAAPETTTDSSVKPKQQYTKSLQDAIGDYKSTYEKYNPSDATNAADKNAPPLAKDPYGVSQQTTPQEDKDYNDALNQVNKDLNKKESPQVSAAKAAKSAVAPTIVQPEVMQPKGINPQGGLTTQIPITPNPAPQLKGPNAPNGQPTIVDPSVARKETGIEPTPKPKTDWGSAFGNVAGYGAAAAQGIMGYNMLKKAGQRPTDHLDPDFVNSIIKANDFATQANLASRYGFTGDQTAMLNNQNQNLLNADRYNARNLSGGSSANAFNMERAASNDAYGRSLSSRVQDTNLKLAKQNIAADRQSTVAGLNWQKQGYNRQLFEDQLNKWMQTQSAGANLLGAGIRNFIGADRYAQDKQAIADRNQNPYA
jgi:hypothetical protein